MTFTTTEDHAAADAGDDQGQVPSDPEAGALIEEDLLVEDVSIDGMCGVY
jgi:mycofactocin precursor